MEVRVGFGAIAAVPLLFGCSGAPDTTAELAVRIEASERSGLAPHVVGFSSAVTNARGAVTYAWDFDDGETATTPGPIHEFTAIGTYEVTLVVSDGRPRGGHRPDPLREER